MSGGKSSEEAKLPPSAQRLRKAREDGNVPHTADLVTVVSLLVTLLVLAALASWIATEMIAMFRTSTNLIQLDFAQASRAIATKSLLTVAAVSGVAFAAAAFSGVLASVLDTMGLVFSAKPLKPDLNRLNPVKGLGKIFSLRNLVEFLAALFKALAVMFILYIVVRLALPDLVRMPYGGVGALVAIVNRYTALLAILVILVLAVSALSQVFLQRWLHKRDLRMTQTEVRREHRDNEGDPQIRSRRRQVMRSGSNAKRPGLAMASFVIRSHNSLIGLRFEQSEVGVPIIVSKVDADGYNAAMDKVRELGLKTIFNPALAGQLGADGKVGQIIPKNTFREVARVIIKNKLASDEAQTG